MTRASSARGVEHDGLVRVAERDVLGNGEPVDEPEVLVHHADAVREPFPRTVQDDALAVDEQLTRLGPVQAAHDRGERALPRAVLAEQRVHFAPPHVDVDVVVGDHARELLDDSPRRERGRWARDGSRAHATSFGNAVQPLSSSA